jgi:hypothetical protein
MPLRLKRGTISVTADAVSAGAPFFDSARRYSPARFGSVKYAARFVTTSLTKVAPPPLASGSSGSSAPVRAS